MPIAQVVSLENMLDRISANSSILDAGEVSAYLWNGIASRYQKLGVLNAKLDAGELFHPTLMPWVSSMQLKIFFTPA